MSSFRDALLQRDGRCLLCGCWLDESTINPHHITTRGAGGSDQPENGIALCLPCHVSVHNGHITPATLRWLLVLNYGYEYEDWLLGDAEDRGEAESLSTFRTPLC